MKRILNAIAELIEAKAELIREEAATTGSGRTAGRTKKGKTTYSKAQKLSTQPNQPMMTDY